jgi:hypothetical protein
VLDFDRRRSLAPVQQRLQTFRGTIQTDAYEVYAHSTHRDQPVHAIPFPSQK